MYNKMYRAWGCDFMRPSYVIELLPGYLDTVASTYRIPGGFCHRQTLSRRQYTSPPSHIYTIHCALCRRRHSCQRGSNTISSIMLVLDTLAHVLGLPGVSLQFDGSGIGLDVHHGRSYIPAWVIIKPQTPSPVHFCCKLAVMGLSYNLL
jgi:hypothetical protein